MPTIIIKMTKAAYEATKSAYHGSKNRGYILDELGNDYGMNRGSSPRLDCQLQKNDG